MVKQEKNSKSTNEEETSTCLPAGGLDEVRRCCVMLRTGNNQMVEVN